MREPSGPRCDGITGKVIDALLIAVEVQTDRFFPPLLLLDIPCPDIGESGFRSGWIAAFVKVAVNGPDVTTAPFMVATATAAILCADRVNLVAPTAWHRDRVEARVGCDGCSFLHLLPPIN